MEKYEEVDKKPLGQIIFHNFLGGLAWGLGATIGLAVVLTILGFIFKNVNNVPILGDFVNQISNSVSKNAQDIRR